MTQRGLRVPHDVAIVGYDDIEFAAAAAVPLSSVRQPREQLGRSAAELLLEEVDNGERGTSTATWSSSRSWSSATRAAAACVVAAASGRAR